MKPHYIILVHHSECHGNTDESRFATMFDYTIELTKMVFNKSLRQEK